MDTDGSNPPWLLITHGYGHSKQSFYSVSDKRYYTKHVPDLCNVVVFASAYGWLVLFDRATFACCLWNPVSMEKIELPVLLNHPHIFYNRCFLSKPPNEPDCHVLFISKDFFHCAFCQVGDVEFVRNSSELGEVHLFSAVSVQGQMYGLASPDFRIVTVHFVGKTLELRPILKEDGVQPLLIHEPSRPWVTMYDNYLIASPCGELLFVHKMYHINYDFRVFSVDTNKKECMELESLGNRAIFLSATGGSFCCSTAGNGIKPNCIYYTKSMSRNLYMFELADRSTTLLLPCRSARRVHTTTYWIENRSFTK